jgi:dephospho-CoA kinase
MKRSGLTADAVRAIMGAQVSRKERLARADDVVLNDGDLAALDTAVEALHRRYLALADAAP